MTCAQLSTKTRSSISRKICHVKSGFQILYAVEQFISLFFKVIFTYAVGLSSNYFSSIMVIHEISRQLNSARIGKICACKHSARGIISTNNISLSMCSRVVKNCTETKMILKIFCCNFQYVINGQKMWITNGGVANW